MNEQIRVGAPEKSAAADGDHCRQMGGSHLRALPPIDRLMRSV